MSTLQLRALLRLYPRAWRARYGDELSFVIQETRANGGVSALSVGIDVAFAGVVERLRSLGLAGTGSTPGERNKNGVLRVLWAWVIFVLGGIGVAKASEYWANAVPPAHRHLPNTAYETLVIAAAIGSVAVATGIALTGLSLLAFLRQGGWPGIRPLILRAIALTVPTVVALVGLAAWAHQLTPAQRNGSDQLYSAAIIVWVLLFVSCLIAWTSAAISTARLLLLKPRTLAIETIAAVAVASTMVVMTGATAIWWVSVAHTAPWYFAGTAPGTHGTIVPLNLVISGAFMLAGAMLGSSGALSAVRNLRHR